MRRIREAMAIAPGWAKSDGAAVVLCAMGIVGMLYSSVRTISGSLVNSGAVGSEAGALQFSLLPLGLVLVLKMLAGWLSDGMRRRYTGGLACAGVVLVLIWTQLFASAYGGVMASDPLAILNCGEEAAAGNTQALFAVGIVAPSCIAAFLWLSIERIADHYRGGDPAMTHEVR